MVKSDNLAPQKARLNFHQGILNSMLFNLFRPMQLFIFGYNHCGGQICVRPILESGNFGRKIWTKLNIFVWYLVL